MSEKVLANSDSGKIVDIRDFGCRRKEQIERWLEAEISRKYGRKDSILENPMIRIITKFEALDGEAQYELYGYARRCILESGKNLSLRDKFWTVIEKGGSDDGSWNDVEEFADTLMIRERTCKVHEAVRC